MKKQYHVISAKNFGYESALGDGTYDYFVFPADEVTCLLKWTTFFQVRNFCLTVCNKYELLLRRFYLPEPRRL